MSRGTRELGGMMGKFELSPGHSFSHHQKICCFTSLQQSPQAIFLWITFFFFLFFSLLLVQVNSQKSRIFHKWRICIEVQKFKLLLSAVFSYYFSIFLTSVLYKSPDWKKLWNKMVIIILLISRQIEDILRFSYFLSSIMNIIFTTSSCKSREVAFREKTFINKFPACCYSRFGSNVTSCLQLPILPCSKKHRAPSALFPAWIQQLFQSVLVQPEFS